MITYILIGAAVVLSVASIIVTIKGRGKNERND